MPLAMKVIAKDRITNHSTITQLAKEITVLRRDEMQHRRLCHVLDVLHSPHKLYVVMVRCTGEDLFSLNERFSDGLQDEIAGRIIAAVADGVRHFHGLGVCHRDLKPGSSLFFCLLYFWID
jgi:serine/threonine protein kinase